MALQNVFVAASMLPADYAITGETIGLWVFSVLIGSGGAPFLGTLWFFYALFPVCLLHGVICRLAIKFMRKERSKLIFYIVLIVITSLLIWLLISKNSYHLVKIKVSKPKITQT